METLELLGVALGLATLAGINLYLTVFVTGLAIQQGWITLLPQYESLAVLSDPIIICVSGVMFFLEFFADKVPWVDSLWDSVHTLIRPIGGAMLAIMVLGESHPVYSVIVGLFAGGMSLTAHGAKAGTRLLTNASPEPFSNVGLSLAEDAGVLAGLVLIYTNPIVALVVAVVAVALAIWLAPRVFRSARAMLWFAWRRVQYALGSKPSGSAAADLPPEVEVTLYRDRGEVAIQWAAPCVTGRGEHLRGNIFGWLLLSSGPEGGLDFVRSSGRNAKLETIPLEGRKAQHVRGLVCDRVVLYELKEGKKQTFQFDRSRRGLVEELTSEVNRRRAAEPLVAVTA